jgi:hypothetical protein
MEFGGVAQLIVAVATLVTALGAFVVALRTGAKVEQTHDLVNGHSQQLLAVTRELGHSEGLGAAATARAAETTP